MNILVVAPHPDDDLIGCGGSMIRHLRNGHPLTVTYMTSGDAGSLRHTKENLTEIREREARQAAKILGINELIFLRNADGYLQYNQNNLVRLINLIREKKPEIIYIPHHRDKHRDHRTTYALATEALRRAGGPWFQECEGSPWTVDTILCYEVWTTLQEISYVENITEFMPLKLEAIRQHQSQIRDIAYDEASRCLNRYRGITTGRGEYCECFQALSIGKIS
jgi:LmbE family N-acetylglucosaminyl deacetylase